MHVLQSTETLYRVSGEPSAMQNQGIIPRPTLDIEMGGPIALDMRGHPLTPAMQAGVVSRTDPGGRGV